MTVIKLPVRQEPDIKWQVTIELKPTWELLWSFIKAAWLGVPIRVTHTFNKYPHEI